MSCDRTVAIDQAAFQHLGLAGPAFTLEEPTGDFARGERLFLVVHRQGEEILARFGGLHANRGAQHDGLAIGDHHRAVRLACNLAGFQDQLAPAPVEFLAEVIEHTVVLTDARHQRTAVRTILTLGLVGRRRLGSQGWLATRAWRSRGPCGRKRRQGSRTWKGRAGSAACRSAACRGVAPRHRGEGKCCSPPLYGAVRKYLSAPPIPWEGVGGGGDAAVPATVVPHANHPLLPTPSRKGRGRLGFFYRRKLRRPISVSYRALFLALR
jgi:hypothetical protein